jgi:hypothetical protein
MMIAPDESSGAGLRLARDRYEARRRVAAMLRGSGLRIRELKRELVISNPGEPDRGRIHMEYPGGDMSLVQTAWSYLGRLQGYQDEDEPGLGAAEILAALGRAGAPLSRPRE